jgi:ubiquinone biosynthesis protein
MLAPLRPIRYRAGMMKTLRVAARDRDRLAEIMSIVSRFGLGALVARFGIEKPGNADEPSAGVDLPRRTRLALEALGPTFVKLGQIFATRGDLLPAEWIAELEQLHSQAPTLAFEDLREAVEQALGQPVETAFASFDPQPLAAASMAQVHRGALPDGTQIVLKIRRPGIRPRVEADLRLIAHFATLAEAANAEIRRFRPAALVGQLAEAMLGELDFTGEGRNADWMRADFAGNPRVVVPKIHWEWTSETLLVMDYIEGVPPRDGDTLHRAGIDPEAIATLGADIVLDMVLINGRFHGDPHPGNLLCLPGNRIALLDLGMIGHVSPRRREEFLGFVQSLASGDPAALADTLSVWSSGNGVSPDRILSAAEKLVARHGQGRIVLRAVVADFLPLLREEGLTLPPDLLLIFKALVTIDGLLLGIQPDFDLTDAMQRSWIRVARARFSPELLAPWMRAVLLELSRIGSDAPRLLRAAVRRLEEGQTVHTSDMPTVVRSAGRLVAGTILLGSLIIGAAILYS